MTALFKNLEPVKVSPLIKFARWTFLIAGVFYGVAKHKALSIREISIREQEKIMKEERDKILKEEKERQSERDIQMLVDIIFPKTKESDESGEGDEESEN